jgi:plastocyanin
MRRTVYLIGIAVTFACGGGASSGGSGGSQATTSQAVAPLGTGTISGVVTFAGTPPANPVIDMSEEPSCAAKYTGKPTDPVVKVADGKLANVFVRVTGGLPAGPYPQPTTKAEINQSGCLYHPRILGVMVGQPLTILNSDSLLHNIKAVPTVNRGFNVSQPQAGMTRDHVFTEPEIMVPLECNVHGWMKAYVGVVAHPYFATSGDDGSFTIGGLPPGTYQLEAWHEKLGTKTAEVTIGPDGKGSVTFSYGAM